MSTDQFQRNRDNFCYRHPDRQSFVLCQRCMRTVCADCRTQAAVGVICPECLAEQQAARTPVQKKAERRWNRGGGALAAVPGGRPVATYAILAVTAAVSVLQFLGGFAGIRIGDALTFYAPLLYPDLTGSFDLWRPLTAALVHSGLWHLGLNLLALWMLGRSLEPLLGTWRFVTLYVLSALGGSTAVALLGFTTPVLGASGAVLGLFGALLVIGRHLGANVAGIAIVLGINVVIGFVPGFNISWQAHLGGAIVGAVVGFVFARTRARRQRGLQIAGLAAVAGVLIVLLALAPVILGYR